MSYLVVLVAFEMPLHLDWSPPVGKFNWLDVIWRNILVCIRLPPELRYRYKGTDPLLTCSSLVPPLMTSYQQGGSDRFGAPFAIKFNKLCIRTLFDENQNEPL